LAAGSELEVEKLMNSRVLVLGATSAIAQATARYFAAAHACLFLVARDQAKLQTLAEDLLARGAQSVGICAMDLTDYSDQCGLISRAKAELGGLDAALIAHGILPDQFICEHDTAALRLSLDTNCVSVVSWLSELADVFESQRSGVIAVIGSVAGDRGRRSNYIYGSAKAAVDAFTAGLRARLAKAGVSVVLIKPGFVDTPMTAHLKKSALYASAQQVARGIYKSMLSPRPVVYLPWFWKWIMMIVKVIPEPVFVRLNL
jgi:decaprenylphospho-beta-D-erythro-pentofuranosid-2-ulose 2-reductase